MLEKSNDSTLSNAVWTISNLSLNSECAEAVMRSDELIYVSILKSMQSSNERVARESVIAITNIMMRCNDESLCLLILRENLYCIINELTYNERNSGLAKLLLNLLDTIFTKFPEQKDVFMTTFGVDPFYRMQATYDDSVYDLAMEFLSKHFELEDEELLENVNEVADN